MFNVELDNIDYGIPGYDELSAQDRLLRSRDPVRFLQEKLFGPHAARTRAVGFKLFYSQGTVRPGLLRYLGADTGLRVVHLRRRNLLRALFSRKLAETTGVWAHERDGQFASDSPGSDSQSGTTCVIRQRVSVSEQECHSYFRWIRRAASGIEALFERHPRLTVWYEDLLQRQQDSFNSVQELLGLEPQPLTVTLRKQNPEKLHSLLENYDELYESLSGTPYAQFFEDEPPSTRRI